ncbi:XrtA/PEP-CTERM system TPR-repeat protein PrsT [Catenovulum maritimum]|uniref:PEP-CTERM system TPR-repeat protein PrsT n=1 Tax=Catenovulum maritimum TaxID=1513271 RepID=A0A0J8GZW7_9ALTE|nr:XrtA/PEP-CTERM system TPR-repeat protein PrsT [Catenovulum maritimum]KMT66293.1 hypothetical protein XM47_04695 [Catenovulum maritimum]
MFNKRPLAIALSATLFAAVAIAETSSEYYENALQFHHKGESKAAVIELKNALQQDYNNVSARILLGKIYLANGEAEAAVKEFSLVKASRVDLSLFAIEYGNALLSVADYTRIIKEIKPTRQDEQLDASIYVLRGNAYQKLGKKTLSKDAFEQAKKLVPFHEGAILSEISLLMDMQQFDKAQSELEAILLDSPNNAQAWFLLAEISKIKGDLKVAIAKYIKAIQLNPKHQIARHTLIEIYLQQSELNLAFEQVNQLKQIWPNDPLNDYYQAILLLRQNKNAEAHSILAELSDKISALDSKQVALNHQLSMINAISYFLLGQSENARSYINQLLLKNPYSLDLALMMAQIELDDGDYYAAQSLLDKWQANQVKNIRYYQVMGSALAKQKQYLRAETILNRGLSLYPNDVVLNRLLAVTYAHQGKQEQAIQKLKKLQSAGGVELLLGYIYLEEGMKQEALALARRLIDTNQEVSVSVKNFYAACLMSNSFIQEAKREFEQILQKEPGYKPAAINLARIYVLTKDTNSAKELLETLIELNGFDYSANELLVEIHLNEGSYFKANQRLEEALTKSSGDDISILKRLINTNLISNNFDAVEKYTELLNEKSPLNAFVIEARIKIDIDSGNLNSARRGAGVLYGLSLNNPEKLSRVLEYQVFIEDLEGAEKTLNRLVFLKAEPAQYADSQIQYLLRKAGSRAALKELHKKGNLLTDMHRLELEKSINLHSGNFSTALSLVESQIKKKNTDLLSKQKISLLRKLGQYNQALDYVTAIIQNNPKKMDYQSIKADILLEIGRNKDAVSILQRLLVNDPTNPRLLNNLASSLAEIDPNQALVYIERAKLSNESAILLDTFGWVLANLGKYEDALIQLRAAYLKAPRQADVNYHLAFVLNKLNRVNEAKSYLSKASQYNPSEGLKTKISALAGSI